MPPVVGTAAATSRVPPLVAQPADAVALIYQFLGQPPFAHDFTDVQYEAEAFDAALLVRGLHRVAGPVGPRPRPSILPPDLFARLSALQFWGKGDSPAFYIARKKS